MEEMVEDGMAAVWRMSYVLLSPRCRSTPTPGERGDNTAASADST